MTNVKPMTVNKDSFTLTFQVSREESCEPDIVLVNKASLHYKNQNFLIDYNVYGGLVKYKPGKVNKDNHFVEITINKPAKDRPVDQRF